MFRRDLAIIVIDIHIIIILSIGFTNDIMSQPGKIDSLLRICNETKFDTVKVDIYNKIAFYLSDDDFEKSDYYSNKAKALAVKAGYETGMSLSEYLMGQTNYNRENYKRALEHYFESLRLSEANDKTIEYAYTIVQIGNTYYLITDYQNSLKYYNKAYEIFDYLDSDDGRSIILNNLANLQTLNSQFDSAIGNYKKALKIDIKQKNLNNIAISNTNIGLLYQKKQQFDSAFNYYKTAIELCNNISDPDTKVRAYNATGDYYLKREDYSQAKYYLNKAYDICVEKNLKNLKAETLLSLSKMYEAKNNNKKALEMLKKHLIISDSINKAENIKKVTIIEYNYEYEKKQKKEKLEQIQKEYKHKITWLKLIFILVIILVIFIVLFVFQKQKNKRNKLKVRNLILQYQVLKKELDDTTNEKHVLQQELSEKEHNHVGLKSSLQEKNKELMTKILKLVSANEAIQVTIKKLTSQKRYLKGEQLKSINESIAELKRHENSDIWQRFELSFQEVYNDFYENLTREYPFLTPNDLKLSAFIKLNLSTKEIASIMNLNPRSVEVARTRLRKKVNISNKDLSLHQFLTKY